RLPDAALHCFGQLAEMDVAVVQLAPGIADADDRLAVEDLWTEAFRPQPGAAREGVVFRTAKPFAAAGVVHRRAIISAGRWWTGWGSWLGCGLLAQFLVAAEYCVAGDDQGGAA